MSDGTEQRYYAKMEADLAAATKQLGELTRENEALAAQNIWLNDGCVAYEKQLGEARALLDDARLLLKAWRGGGFPREATQTFLDGTAAPAADTGGGEQGERKCGCPIDCPAPSCTCPDCVAGRGQGKLDPATIEACAKLIDEMAAHNHDVFFGEVGEGDQDEATRDTHRAIGHALDRLAADVRALAVQGQGAQREESGSSRAEDPPAMKPGQRYHVGPKLANGNCSACRHLWALPPDYPPCESTGAPIEPASPLPTACPKCEGRGFLKVQLLPKVRGGGNELVPTPCRVCDATGHAPPQPTGGT